MNYEKFCTILNKHIFEDEKKNYCEKLLTDPNVLYHIVPKIPLFTINFKYV
jgi:hypothetical protein